MVHGLFLVWIEPETFILSVNTPLLFMEKHRTC